MPDLFTGGYGPRPTYQDESWAMAPWNLYKTPPNPLQPASGLGGTPPATSITPNSGLPTTYGTGPLSPAIAGLIQPGLVPDIARMSAETSAGRGVAGSPAADSIAVKMSEQNYLQRLGLANQLMTGEAGRALPYQITPLQSAELANRLAVAGMRNFPGGSYGYGGNMRNPYGSPYASRSGAGYSGGGSGLGGGGATYPFTGGLGGMGSLGGGYSGGGGGGQSLTLDDIYEQLGFGNFGSQPGDTIGGTEPPDFDWEMWE